jgi:hypothetical protein
MSQIIRGIVRGRIIELQDDPGLDEGQQIEVELRPLINTPQWGDGIRRSAGALSDVPGLDEEIEAIVAERQLSLHREIEP